MSGSGKMILKMRALKSLVMKVKEFLYWELSPIIKYQNNGMSISQQLVDLEILINGMQNLVIIMIFLCFIL